MKEMTHKKIDISNPEKLIALGKALSSEKRLDLLLLLEKEALNINEISARLQIPASSAAMHVKALEEAGLILTDLRPGIRGSMKICKRAVDEIEISLTECKEEQERIQTISMPIGNFVDYQVEPTCGIVGRDKHIDEEDEPRCFYNPKRTTAQLIWFGKGYVEYRFPNSGLDEKRLKKLELSAELCSETADYNMDCPSDITVWIGGVEVGTWECPSDFGGRRGKQNPDWWPDKNTQYGMLKTWTISGAQIKDYQLSALPYIAVRIGIKEDAKHVGGINIFGEAFGDYAQDIVMKFYY